MIELGHMNSAVSSGHTIVLLGGCLKTMAKFVGGGQREQELDSGPSHKKPCENLTLPKKKRKRKESINK